MEAPVEVVDIKKYPEVLQEIGKLRFDVWFDEGEIDPLAIDQSNGENSWTDELDEDGHHFIIRDLKTGLIIAAARMTLHTDPADTRSRDFVMFMKSPTAIPLPTVDLGRLIVKNLYRGRGYASALNEARVQEAKQLGAKSVIVTASLSNAKLLEKLGFTYTGETVYFSDRPRVEFHAMLLMF